MTKERFGEAAANDEAARWKSGTPKRVDNVMTGIGRRVIAEQREELVPMTPHEAGLSEHQAWKLPGVLTDARRAATNARAALKTNPT